MNDPITLAATPDDDPRELPGTTDATTTRTATSTEPIRTLPETAERVSLLKETGQSPDHGDTGRPARPADPAGQRPAAPQARDEPLYEEPFDDPYDESYASYEQYRRAHGRTAHGSPYAPGRTGALRRTVRRPVVAALLVCGVLHLPGDVTALPSQTPLAFLPLLAAVLCLGLGALLAVRETAGVWRAGAAAAVAVVALHVVGGVTGFDPLAGAVSGSLAWAGATAVLCAAAAAVLAGLALVNRSPQARAGAGG
ncbi:hypothetical protein [Streptomyces sp. NPDC097981]|uniref:hypothetical protein n=1 Tax=Streptomyces sp. NPDC097981 TaxID=3155428 RepID=UPI003319F506